ncbi:MAG: hypothetical protein AB7O32_15450 [Vicinamibacterales bacterium]
MKAAAFVRTFTPALLVVLAAGCSKGDQAPSSNGSGSGAPGDPATTITITSSGVSPTTLTVARGTQVTFVNQDSRTHEMASDPHPTHTECPELNAVGFLAVGARRQTGNLNTVMTCGFHDHNLPQNTSLQGRIVVQ